MSLEFIAMVVAVAPLIPLVLTLFNVATWRRGRPTTTSTETISVLIPARNEATNIEACLEAVCESRLRPLEVLVYDDDSVDDTARRVEAIMAKDNRVRLIRGADLPRGWAGKSHACHQLAQAARGEVLLFIDADVRLMPEGIGRLVSGFEDLGAHLCTAIPRQQTITWAERLILPLLHLTYTSWLPLPLVHLSRDPRFLAVSGQIMAIKRGAFRQMGGFEAVKDDVVEDMAFGRLAKQHGFRVVFMDGHHIAVCRMYSRASEVWDGFSKNLYRGLGARLSRLVLVFALYLVCFVGPYAMLAALAGAWFAGGLATPPPAQIWGLIGFGVLANIMLRGVLAWRYEQPWSGLITHPLSVACLVAIGVNSYLWHQRGTIKWRGRVYGHQTELTTTAPPGR